MNCPRCEKALNEIVIDKESDAAVHLCPGCEGIFFPTGTISVVANTSVEDLEAGDLSPALVEDQLENINVEDPVNCPECGKEMERYSYMLAPDVELDECLEHGMWLDDGELGVVVEQMTKTKESSQAKQEKRESIRKQWDLESAVKGSAANPFSWTLRALNYLFKSRV